MPALALSSSTYADLSPTSNNVQNLLSCAMNYDSFLYSDYVVFQDGQYSYRIVWADKLTVSGSTVSSDSSVEYITYSRNGSNYDYTYVYDYGTDSTFRLSANHLIVSNVEGLGARSELYSNFQNLVQSKHFRIFMIALTMVIAFVTLRKGDRT